MLKIEVVKFEAQDVITTSVAAPSEDEILKELESCVCPEFKCGINAANEFEHKNGCNCATNVHWITD